MTKKAEQCENCDKLIGKLEQAYVYEGRVVCEQCNELLRQADNKKEKVKKTMLLLGLILLGCVAVLCLAIYLSNRPAKKITINKALIAVNEAKLNKAIETRKAAELEKARLRRVYMQLYEEYYAAEETMSESEIRTHKVDKAARERVRAVGARLAAERAVLDEALEKVWAAKAVEARARVRLAINRVRDKDFEILLDAIAIFESGGRPDATSGWQLGQESAIGLYQIRHAYVKVVNRILGVDEQDPIYEHGVHSGDRDDRLNPVKSREIASIYLQHYGEGLTLEEAARIHKGGPNGHLQPSTKEYGKKVMKVFRQIKKRGRTYWKWETTRGK